MKPSIAKLFNQIIAGRWVRYVPQHGPPEIGRIKYAGENWIFVVYRCNEDWDNYQDYTAAGTNPDDLILIDDPRQKAEHE